MEDFLGRREGEEPREELWVAEAGGDERNIRPFVTKGGFMPSDKNGKK